MSNIFHNFAFAYRNLSHEFSRQLKLTYLEGVVFYKFFLRGNLPRSKYRSRARNQLLSKITLDKLIKYIIFVINKPTKNVITKYKQENSYA
jgi:hypothetical protein